MNKKMKEILAAMRAKMAEIKATEGEKAAALLEEYDELKKAFDVEKKAFEAEKELAEMTAETQPAPAAEEKKLTTDEIVAKQVRHIGNPLKYSNKGLSDTIDEDGKYTIPVDTQTKINQYKQESCDWSAEITIENVTAPTGSRVYQKRGHAAPFIEVGADGMLDGSGTDKKTHEVDSPKFEQLTYAVKKYGGFMPIPNDLLRDSDANITSVVYQWLADAQVATDNDKILALLGQNGSTPMTTGWTDLKDLDGMKKAVNVTLGQAFAGSIKIYTNDDGLQYLDTLKEKADSNKPLLTPVPNEPSKLQLTIGFRTIPVVVKPNAFFKSVAATASAGGKIPMIIGDLKEIVKYNRMGQTLEASTVAAIGKFNAFSGDMTLVKSISRADYKIKDADAIVKGYIGTPKLSA